MKHSESDEQLIANMRTLYAEHVKLCASYEREPVMRDPDELVAVFENLRTLHDLDAMMELHAAWTMQLRLTEMLIKACSGFDNVDENEA